MRAPAVRFVVEQHAEELATLWATRNGLAANGYIRLRQLARFDERIAAHEDGCVIASDAALEVLTAELANVSAGRVFATAVAALDLNHRATIARCLTLAEASPNAHRGMRSAVGWVSASRLTGIVKDLLAQASSSRRTLGLAACRLHGADPGAALAACLGDDDPDVRAESTRTAGVLGLGSLLRPYSAAENEPTSDQFWRLWSAVLLGDRGAALRALTDVAMAPGSKRARAFRLVCQATSTTVAREILRDVAADPMRVRCLIEGSGVVGDPEYVPWLIKHMGEPKAARLAAESFSLITGVDLSASKLDATAPDNVKSTPTDDPDDTNVAMDPDEDLPWPDLQKVEAWWRANGDRFQKGVRYFMGHPLTRENCINVLKTGYQRQRILAAHYLCLLEPGTPLFNTSAPAWRQQRWLAKMA